MMIQKHLKNNYGDFFISFLHLNFLTELFADGL